MENGKDPVLEPVALKLDPCHLNQAKATAYVVAVARLLGISVPSGDAFRQDVRLDGGGGGMRFNFARAVEETRLTGVPSALQFLLDARDPFLAPAIPMSVGVLPKGIQLKMGATLGEFKVEAPAPGRIESPESALADDILAFRRSTCDFSRAGDADAYTRHYRAYLQACVSLVDCFLSRYSHYVKTRIGSLDQFDNTKVLGSVTGLDKRIEAWILTFACHHMHEYRKTPEWSQFQELRTQRNRFVHPTEPIAAFSLRDISKYLNFCKGGVGGLLETFRTYTGFTPFVGFIQRVKSAPMIRFDG